VAKKRTKKQKQNVKHPFLVSWDPKLSQAQSLISVKGQKNKSASTKSRDSTKSKNAYLLEKDTYLASVRHDILKSLAITSFILGLEVMLYLAWII
jgi:hypothetical protein